MRNTYLFLTLVFFAVTTEYLLNQFVHTEEYYRYTLQENFTEEQIGTFITTKKNSQWLTLVKVPLSIALKTLIVALLVSAGIRLYEKELDFGSVFNIGLLAEAAYILPPLIKLMWFSFSGHSDFDEIIHFPTFSLADFTDQDNFPRWLLYPLNTLSVFELIYILLLTVLLARELEVKLNESLKIILSSYGLGFALWTAFVAFLLVNLGV